MVEIMERQQDVEWSPDMELDGCDAEKAATLLLAVAPRHRSTSIDVEETKAVGVNGTRSGRPSSSNDMARDDHGYGGDMKPPLPLPPPPAYGPISGSPAWAPPGGREADYDGQGANRTDAVSRQADGLKREEVESGDRHLSPRLSPLGGRPRGEAVAAMSSSPARLDPGCGSGLLSLAHLATQELLTMRGEGDDGQPCTGALVRTPPPRSRNISPNRHQSLRLSGTRSMDAGHGAAASAASGGGSVGTSPRPVRHHNHHLRERLPRGARRSLYHDEDQEAQEEEALARRARRNRPRSVSMPEGMERDSARAWSGVHSSNSRNGRRIDVIEEELDVHEGVGSTRSRAWRVGSAVRDSPRAEGLVGSVEDAEALIALARQRVGWGVEPEEGAEGVGTGEGGMAGEGEDGAICVSLPHMLSKYADLYNKNGRIGIYTRQERAAIIARFKRKRGRRVWKKKIRYNCRKNLADKRLRVKGRFVKMSPEQRAALKLKQKAMRSARASGSAAESGSTDMELLVSEELSSEAGSGGSGSGSGGSGSANHTEGFEDEPEEEDIASAEADEEESEEGDDVEDEALVEDEEEANFAGAEPMKRLRRHSIAY